MCLLQQRLAVYLQGCGTWACAHTAKRTLAVPMLQKTTAEAFAQGPAVWALRAQTDKHEYAREMRRVLEAAPNLAIREGMAVGLALDASGGVAGVRTFFGITFRCRAAVLTTGTFMNGRIWVGRASMPAGRCAGGQTWTRRRCLNSAPGASAWCHDASTFKVTPLWVVEGGAAPPACLLAAGSLQGQQTGEGGSSCTGGFSASSPGSDRMQHDQSNMQPDSG